MSGHQIVRPYEICAKQIWSCATFALLCILFSLGCHISESHQVAEAISPDKAFKANLQEENAGATTSFGYVVAVTDANGMKPVKVAGLYGAMRNEQAYGVNLQWINRHCLQLTYLRAKAILYVHTEITLNRETIHIILKDHVQDPNAPSGGMFYNLRRKQ